MLSGVGGALLLVGGVIAAPSLTDGSLASGGLAGVLTARLGDVGGRLLLACVAVAVVVCTLAVQTSGSRMVYSMARERAFPFASLFGRVSTRTGTPIGAAVLVGVGAAVALAVNWDQSAVFTALTSLCIALLYLAYLGVTLPLLVRRLRGELPSGTDEFGRPLFSLGRWGVPVNVLAVVYQTVMVVNLAWPRASVYDLTGGTWWLQWSALLFIAATVLVGVVVHRRNRARHGGPIVLGRLQVSEPVASDRVEEPA